MLNWGIIGAGIIAEKLADAVRSVEGCRIAAVASKSAQRAEAFAVRNQIETACSYAELVDNPDIDVVYVATTHNYHRENVRLALEHGKSVLVEKPFTVNGSEARDIADLARDRGLFLMEAMWIRFLPSFRRLQEAVAEGRIGEVRQVSVHFGKFVQPQFAARLSDPNLAGGASLDLGCYPISFISGILGERPSEVQSMCRLSDSGVDELDDYSFRYPSGALAQVCTGFQLFMADRALFYGTQGYIDYPDFQGGESFTIHRHDGTNRILASETITAPRHENGFVYQVQEVKHCLASERTESPRMPLSESVALMEVLDRMREDWGLKYPFE